MTILGIESSCDETAAAVYSDRGLQSNVIASQTIHEQYGGVVPELASRAHQKTIWSTVTQALAEAGMTMDDIEGVAVTRGPGLMGALLVGISFAKGLAIAHDKPIMGINHIDAHLYANFIEGPDPVYPFIGLIVSGGHTQIVYVEEPFSHKILGQTRDDAAGEAFDKIGKIMGLPYPAGPVMDRLSREGDPSFHNFPRALLHEGLDFSFSGLKTSVLYYLQDMPEEKRKVFLEEHQPDLSASVTEAITDVLVIKLSRAIRQTGVKQVLVAGGVAANSVLRGKVETLCDEMELALKIPRLVYCTDNAAMIAVTGYLKTRKHQWDSVGFKPFASL
ncbi:MAG TPA: tRNA (adenosine(37)-N6)-threonylcarbamoyltransferase complex transferase subunit TsaD [Balneolales bacterium]|nr:tRNA (adenosine(37)-N6)-threonylcarbamoyltransferase complex transferase subunit TsaD [Balneolales bacterium]